MTAPPQFTVTLHHLAPDAKQAGVDFADVELAAIPAEKLHELLEGLASLAPGVAYPVVPELRVAARDGHFFVQVKDGRIRFSSWSLRTGASDLTPDQIFEAITGTAREGAEVLARSRNSGGTEPKGRYLKIALLAVAIVGSNGVTAWVLTRPAPDLLPEYRLLETAPGRRLLSEITGDYETGSGEGDRRLIIRPDGTVRWAKYGRDRSIIEEVTLTSQPAQTRDRRALLTSERALIEVADVAALVYYGDTYRRRAR